MQPTDFTPHPITDTESFEFQLMGSVKAGFPSPAEHVRVADLVTAVEQYVALYRAVMK